MFVSSATRAYVSHSRQFPCVTSSTSRDVMKRRDVMKGDIGLTSQFQVSVCRVAAVSVYRTSSF